MATADTRFCSECGKPVPRSAKFCAECGTAQTPPGMEPSPITAEDQLDTVVEALLGMGWIEQNRSQDSAELVSSRSGKKVVLSRDASGRIQQSGEVQLDLSRILPDNVPSTAAVPNLPTTALSVSRDEGETAIPETETMVRIYQHASGLFPVFPRSFARDARHLAQSGWHVVSVAEQEQRSSCLRIFLLGGIGALVFHPKPKTIVAYERTKPIR
jgi:hypothetical protein